MTVLTKKNDKKNTIAFLKKSIKTCATEIYNTTH